jgi:hypothetical protein
MDQLTAWIWFRFAKLMEQSCIPHHNTIICSVYVTLSGYTTLSPTIDINRTGCISSYLHLLFTELWESDTHPTT